MTDRRRASRPSTPPPVSRTRGRAMPRRFALRLAAAAAVAAILGADAAAEERFHRLHEGLTVYVQVPDAREFTVGLDVRDLNLQANGPREILFKVYDPSGKPAVREVIPDDGCTTANLPDRIGGWDHELQSFVNHFVKGTTPSIRWSAWSDPARLATIQPRRFDRTIAGGPGIYRIVLAGGPDHYVTLRLDPALKTAIAGHPTFIHGHGDLLRKAWIYVPPGTTGLFVAVAEPDEPRSRTFTLTGPDGKRLFDGVAKGGYDATDGPWKTAGAKLEPGAYDGKSLALEVSPGPNDYLLKVTLQRKEPYADYVGMGALAVFAPDPDTAATIKGGTIEADGQIFFHPFQVRLHEWLRRHPLDGSDADKSLRAEAETIAAAMRMLETSDGRGSQSWTNWAYAMGYYGCRIFKSGWKLLGRTDVPDELRGLVREGLIMAGDRLAFATHMEKVNGNAFAQIPVALWYCHRATGDPLQKQLFETFWQRWTTEGWGAGSGLSRSGDAQEHFAHDMHYGSYLFDNWGASDNTWVKEGGILGDAADDPRFQRVVDRYRELYTHLACAEADGRPVAANPWSARTHMPASKADAGWKVAPHVHKALPGPDFTVSVNGGDEWFAARRPGYYVLTFHGRLAPEWMCQCFEGQLGFGGGAICQLTVPGRGPVLASTLHESYGKGMHPSEWPRFRVHTLVAERWDGVPVISGISEHGDAKLEGTTVTSSGEIRGAHVRAARSYTFGPVAIECSVRLAKSDYARVMSIWSHERKWAELRSAVEMIPFMPTRPDGKTPTAVTTAEGAPLTAEGATTKRVRIDRGGFGVDVETPAPATFRLGQSHTVLLELLPDGAAPTPPDKVAATYKLVPFAN